MVHTENSVGSTNNFNFNAKGNLEKNCRQFYFLKLNKIVKHFPEKIPVPRYLKKKKKERCLKTLIKVFEYIPRIMILFMLF